MRSKPDSVDQPERTAVVLQCLKHTAFSDICWLSSHSGLRWIYYSTSTTNHATATVMLKKLRKHDHRWQSQHYDYSYFIPCNPLVVSIVFQWLLCNITSSITGSDKSFPDRSTVFTTYANVSHFIRPLCVRPAANHESYGQHVSIYKVRRQTAFPTWSQ